MKFGQGTAWAQKALRSAASSTVVYQSTSLLVYLPTSLLIYIVHHVGRWKPRAAHRCST
jgi:hypothetical protein